MHECIDSTEDARPATICSGSQGCGGSESIIYRSAATFVGFGSPTNVAL